MKYIPNQVVHGFRVLRAENVPELEGNAVRMEHAGTGAQLFWLDNGEENKVFSIAFRTPPEDSTGVFHILEHSVLCGSRKYPVKEPFVELLKSSMSTFLNAMTFPDMTLYPVSSRNPRDLMNLTEVYLDAVFAPEAMKDRKRFCQEGWHIDRDENGNPEYRGVVYNEMKGAMSETDTLIDRELIRMLFPDTFCGFNSGGDPEEIPRLTYERYQEQYRRCYHPSNALIYLDGDIPMEEMLTLLDTVFRGFGRRETNPSFAMQTPKACERTIRYELGQEEDPENKGYLTLARITGTWRDRTENMARGIVCDVLTGTNEAPLKRAALERGLAQDLNLSVDDTGLQSWIAAHAEHVTDGREKEILQLLTETGRKILQDGLDRNALEASLNRAIYHLREEEEPRGIGRCIRCMGSWLYGGEPESALVSEGMIAQLREYLEDGTFNRLAADMLLNRDGAVLLHTLPSKTLGEEKRQAETREILRTLERMTEEERAGTEKLMDEIGRWQNTPDREEDLATLPMLRREDADLSPEWIKTESETLSGVRVMIHRIPCNGVAHFRAYFTLTDLPAEELTQTALLAGMLGHLPTRQHDALTLQQEIKRYTGSFGFAVTVRSRAGEDRVCTPCLTAFASALEENAEKTQELIAEVLGSTLLEGQEDRIRELMMQNEIGARQRIISAGHLIAVRNCLSHYSAEGIVKNALDGDRAVRYIHSFALHPEQEMPGFLETARKVLDESVCRARMTVSVTAGKQMVPETLAGAFPEGTPVPEAAEYHEETPGRVGYRIPAQTGFAARGYRLSRCGQAFSGCMWLAGSILTLDYLWNRVRVQGGAYGAGFQTDRAGNLFSYSFRDPSPGKTLSADRKASAFLRAFVRSGENLDKYVISSLNELNPLLSPRDKGALADARMLTGYTREESERIRLEILHATPEDLLACGDWLDRFAEEGSVCVVAHADALKTCDGLFVSDL